MATQATSYIEPVRRFVASPVRTTEVNVIFTTPRGTLAAMRTAAALSRVSGASVRLIDPRPVHIPLRAAGYALAAGEVPIEEREREGVIAAAGVPVEVQVYVCGHPSNVARVALHDRSLVIVGGRRSWFPTRLERFQRALESQGHVVMFVPEPKD
jgi:hypothetical protein